MRALLVVVLALTGSAYAGDPPARPVRVEDDGRHIRLSVEYPELFDAALARKLDSGFATHVVVRAWLTRDGSSRPEALAVRTFRAAYDLWDEVWLVEERDEAGIRTVREATRAAVLRRLTRLDRVPIADAMAMVDGIRYTAAVLVEVNPVSPELLAQVRRWLSRPPDGHRFGGAGGESFFGSFVSIFVNPRVGDAEKVLRLRSEPFFRPVPVQRLAPGGRR